MSINKLLDLDSLNDQEIVQIANYRYKHLGDLMKMRSDDPHYLHMKANVIGEMYEYVIYEKLLKWAIKSEDVTEFILKGPYVEHVHKHKEGFQYDAKHQIYYNSGGETIAEFDSIFKKGNTIVFVEISTTETKKLINNLKAGIKRKFKLLRYLFPGDEIRCWIITSSSQNINLNDLKNTDLTRTKQYKLEPDTLINNKDSRSVVVLEHAKLKLIYALENNTFHYYPLLDKIHRNVEITTKTKTIEKIKTVVKPYTGLIERFFIGKLSASSFIKYIHDNGYEFPKNIRVKNAYLAYKIDEDLSITDRIYLSTEKQRYYEIQNLKQMDIKKVTSRKRAPRDIKYLDEYLEYISIEKWNQFVG